MYGVNRVLWFRAHMPEVYQRAWKWLCWQEFFLGKLGLPPAIDWSLAARTLAFDLRARHWSRELLDAAELSEEQFAPAVPAGTVVGEIPPAVADDLGLPRGVLGVCGSFDQACAPLGAGVVDPGTASIGTGSIEALAIPLAGTATRSPPRRCSRRSSRGWTPTS
jgi:xylulokinase